MFNLFTTAYAEAVATSAEATTGAAGTAQASGMFSIVWLVAMIVVFYFVLIRPQKKQEKKMREMLAALKVGDKVITAGGIAGKIVKIKDDFVWLETGFVGNPEKLATLKMEKAAIRTVEAE